MTEQEKQAIRERFNELMESGYTMSLVGFDVKTLLNALDERDRELERLRNERKLMLRDSVWERDERLKQDAEIERLRKALDRISNTYLCECGEPYRDCTCGFYEIHEIARQALSGEEK
jgi:hypothetical protein